MGNAARQGSQGLHFLRLEKLLLQPAALFFRLLALVDVLHHPQEVGGTSRRVVEKGNVGRAPNGLTGLAQVARFETDLPRPVFEQRLDPLLAWPPRPEDG